jgi:hypothetical protein
MKKSLWTQGLLALSAAFLMTACGEGAGTGGDDDQDDNLTTNRAPIAIDQNLTMNEDTAKNITFTGTDADGDPLTYTVTRYPEHGVLSGTAPDVTYTPYADYDGSDIIIFKVNDGAVDSAGATVRITVRPVNRVPVAADDTHASQGGAGITLIDVLANDVDEDGDALVLKAGSLTAPTRGGEAVIDGNRIAYTPPADYNGIETFGYTVTDGHGGEDSATVTVTIAGAWDGNGTILEHNGGGSASPEIAVSPNGSAFVIWSQRGADGTDNIYTNRYDPDSNRWDANVTLMENGDGNASSPRIAAYTDAAAGEGRAFVVWRQTAGGHENIYTKRFAGGQWDRDATLLENSNGDAALPHIAANRDGHAFAIWEQRKGEEKNIYAKRFDGLVREWDADPVPLDDLNGSALKANVVMNDQGGALARWKQRVDRRYVGITRRYDDARRWEANATLLYEPLNRPSSYDYQSAVDSQGNFMVIWEETNPNMGTEATIKIKRTIDGRWENNSTSIIPFVRSWDREGDKRRLKAQIALDPGDNVFVTWRQLDRDVDGHWHWRACARRYDAAAGEWDAHISPLRLTVSGQDDDPQIAAGSDGSAFVTWVHTDDDNRSSVYFNRYDAVTGQWDERATLMKADADAPKIASDARGHFFIVWDQRGDNHSYHVMCRRY